MFVVPLLMMLCVFVTFGPGISSAQEDIGRKAFSQKKYPWYDADSDQVKRMEMNERPQIRSINRESIPLKPVTGTKPTAKKSNWGNFGSLLSGLSMFVWVLIGAVIIGIAAVLFWAFLLMEPNIPQDDELSRRRSMAESIKQLPFDLDSESGDFRLAAHNAYLAGDFGAAMTYLFSHVLVALDQKGLIRLRRGKTNRQYLRELRPYRSLANSYQRMMVPFEATFFGGHDLAKQDFESCWNQLDDFQVDVDRASQVAHG